MLHRLTLYSEVIAPFVGLRRGDKEQYEDAVALSRNLAQGLTRIALASLAILTYRTVSYAIFHRKGAWAHQAGFINTAFCTTQHMIGAGATTLLFYLLDRKSLSLGTTIWMGSQGALAAHHYFQTKKSKLIFVSLCCFTYTFIETQLPASKCQNLLQLPIKLFSSKVAPWIAKRWGYDSRC